MTARSVASLSLTDGSRLTVTRDGSRLQIQGTIIAPGVIALTVNGQEIALKGATIDQTMTVSGSAPVTVIVTERSPAGTRSASSAVLNFSAAGSVATSTIATSAAARTTASSVVTRNR